MEALTRRSAVVVVALAAFILAAVAVVAEAGAAKATSTFSISGTVTLPAGAPADYLGSVKAFVSEQDGPSWGYQWVNTTDGTYTISGLTPGHYLVSFPVGNGMDPVPPLADEWYSNSHTVDNAALVTITASDVTGIDATLEWSGSISGTVTVAPGTPDASKTGLVAVATSATTGNVVALVDATTGAYTIPYLPNGSYTVLFQASVAFGGDTLLRNEVYNDMYDVADATPVVVADGAATTGINAELSRTGHFTSTATPVITHLSLAAGSTLGINGGNWAPQPTFSMRWYRNGAPISGAVGPQYVLTTADRGKDITFTLTASKAGFTTVIRTSDPLHIPLAFTTTVTPTITGSVRAGSTLTAHNGTWSPAMTSASYQWKVDGGIIDGATGSTYVVATADRGHSISVTVTGMRAGYLPTAKTSAYLDIPKVFATTPVPTIIGTAKAGSTLTVHRGTWSPTATTYTYRWYRNGVAISGATHTTYKLTTSDKGKQIIVKVTGAKSGYLTTTTVSVAKTVAH